MKIKTGKFKNFGSYKEVEINFSNQGLTLISGSTGSGKSTIPDMVSWVIFGVTAKNGSVDDVRSWFSEEPTTGTLEIELYDGIKNTKIFITRIRGRSNENDLFWTDRERKIRGKDINDTQALLEAYIRVSSHMFIAGSYFHEFSSTGLFFSAKAKDRREVFEKIADLELATKLSTMASSQRRDVSKTLDGKIKRLEGLFGRQEELQKSIKDSTRRSEDFKISFDSRIQEIIIRKNGFEEEKRNKIEVAKLKTEKWQEAKDKKIDVLIKKIETLEDQSRSTHSLKDRIEELEEAPPCSECGQQKGENKKQIDRLKIILDKNYHLNEVIEDTKVKLKETIEIENPYLSSLEDAINLVNTYEAQLLMTKQEVNPFISQIFKLKENIEVINTEISEVEASIRLIGAKEASLNQLCDISSTLRGELLKKSVKQVESQTNQYLEKYFDSEIRVSFSLGKDDLNVTIYKSGYECNYKQLSKGQRGLLKLCFVVSVMQAASNKAGVHFDNLFFDEALDGLDAELKVKAYGLFEELSLKHSSIMVIEHSTEFQSLFTNQYKVTMESDISQIEQV